jgi:hypothetical protein
MAGSVQSVNAGPPQLRSELLEQARQGQDLGLHILMQRVELGFKLIANLDNPAHSPPHRCNMIYTPYDVKSIDQ